MCRGLVVLIIWLSGGVFAARGTPVARPMGLQGADVEILRESAESADALRMTGFVEGRRTATVATVATGVAGDHRGAREQSPEGGSAQTVATGAGAQTVATGVEAQTQSVTVTVDGIAARIEGDIVTESQLNELAGFQKLVEGKAGNRADLLRELTDQWIVNAEAQTARFGRPKADDLTQAFSDLEKRFASPEAFQKAIVDAGLTETAVRRQLELQIFLSRFLDYKFRPAAQVSESEIQDYYNGEFTKLAQARGEKVPPLDDMHADIRRLLTEKIINQRAEKWLDETRPRLRVEVFAAPDKS